MMPDPQWRIRFIEALQAGCQVKNAAHIAGVDPHVAWDARNSDAGFRADWDAALEYSCELWAKYPHNLDDGLFEP